MAGAVDIAYRTPCRVLWHCAGAHWFVVSVRVAAAGDSSSKESQVDDAAERSGVRTDPGTGLCHALERSGGRAAVFQELPGFRGISTAYGRPRGPDCRRCSADAASDRIVGRRSIAATLVCGRFLQDLSGDVFSQATTLILKPAPASHPTQADTCLIFVWH